MKKETLTQVKAVYDIESKCIAEMEKFFDEESFSDAVELRRGDIRRYFYRHGKDSKKEQRIRAEGRRVFGFI